jgi:hypothetical protein
MISASDKHPPVCADEMSISQVNFEVNKTGGHAVMSLIGTLGSLMKAHLVKIKGGPEVRWLRRFRSIEVKRDNAYYKAVLSVGMKV